MNDRCRVLEKCHPAKQCIFYMNHGGDCVFSGNSETIKLRRALDDLEAEKALPSASEALYAFAGWLTTRSVPVTMSAVHNAAIVAELVDDFCTTNNLPVPRDGWEKTLKHPKEAA